MAVTIEEIRNLNDPQRAYKWNVILPPVNDPLPEFLGNAASAGVSTANERLNSISPRVGSLARQASNIVGGQLDRSKLSLRGFNPSVQVEEVQGLPFPGVDREAFYEGGRNTYFPSIEDIQPVTIVFYLDQSSRIQTYIRDWKRLIVNENGTKNLPVKYKKSIRVQLLDGLNRPVFDYRLLGCFPTQTVPLNLNQDSERLTYTQEFSIDRVEYLPSSLEGLLRDSLTDKLRRESSDFLTNNAAFSNIPTIPENDIF